MAKNMMASPKRRAVLDLLDLLGDPMAILLRQSFHGLQLLLDLLGDLYWVTRILIDPHQLGWAARRPRQILVLFLKSWIFPILEQHGATCSEQEAD